MERSFLRDICDPSDTVIEEIIEGIVFYLTSQRLDDSLVRYLSTASLDPNPFLRIAKSKNEF